MKNLLRAKPKSASRQEISALSSVVGRAGIVMLTSHFERYIYAANEEAVGFVNQQSPSSHKLPLTLRLQHSKPPLDELERTSWENRAQQLHDFASTDAWLWRTDVPGDVLATPLLAWMKSPKPKALIRYYRIWEIENIFKAITRNDRNAHTLRLQVQGFVDKRNAIAHGDLGEKATRRDVWSYMKTARNFCERSDRQLARAIAKLLGSNRPW
ncbi:MAG: HEPN domain-containing protein [Planctomycetota bacterium]